MVTNHFEAYPNVCLIHQFPLMRNKMGTRNFNRRKWNARRNLNEDMQMKRIIDTAVTGKTRRIISISETIPLWIA